jgi:hypothetical protein
LFILCEGVFRGFAPPWEDVNSWVVGFIGEEE